SAPHQLIGAWDGDAAKKIANVLARLGTKRSWVVHGEDGMDEITLTGKTFVYEVCCDNVREFELSPLSFDRLVIEATALPRASTSAESASIVRNVLENGKAKDVAEDLVTINAAAAIYLSGATGSLQDAYGVAVESIRSKKASAKLQALASAT